MNAYLTAVTMENEPEAVSEETFAHLKQKLSLCAWLRVHLFQEHADQQVISI